MRAISVIEVRELFEVAYGHSLELSRLTPDPAGVNFVSRTAKHNGVVIKVKTLNGVIPLEAGTISVAAGGSVMASFLQPEPYYTAFHVFCLKPRFVMSDAQKLYYCACLWANRYRFNYGRQANRTLGSLLIPDTSEIPHWANNANTTMYNGRDAPLVQNTPPNLDTTSWHWFVLEDLFEIKKGKRLTSRNRSNGTTPYIGAIEANNGIADYIGQDAIHAGGTISVSYNGSVAEAFYQPHPFWATDDVNVLYPRFAITPEIALFICAVIRQEKYRFNYGRKWHLERMRATMIRLPANKTGTPDWPMMTEYILRLPFSSCLALN